MTNELQVIEAKLPQELEKMFDIRVQKMLVLDYFFRNKSLSYISTNYQIPIYDLKFYFYTVEAQSLYKSIKEDLKDYPQENSLKYVRELLVDKLEALMNDTKGKESADIIEKIVPQIIMLAAAIHKTEGGPSNRSFFDKASVAQEIAYEDLDEETTMHDLNDIDIAIHTEEPVVISAADVIKEG